MTPPHAASHVSACDPFVVADAVGTPLALGFFNPESMFRVRVLTARHADGTLPSPSHWIVRDEVASHIRAAVSARAAVALPSADTDIYSVVNSHADGLSGLFIDCFASVAVVVSCAAWCETFRHDVECAVRDALPHLRVI